MMAAEAGKMPDPVVRVGDFLREWWEHRVMPILRKAPRERPDLLVYVCALALVVIALYATIWVSHV